MPSGQEHERERDEAQAQPEGKKPAPDGVTHASQAAAAGAAAGNQGGDAAAANVGGEKDKPPAQPLVQQKQNQLGNGDVAAAGDEQKPNAVNANDKAASVRKQKAEAETEDIEKRLVPKHKARRPIGGLRAAKVEGESKAAEAAVPGQQQQQAPLPPDSRLQHDKEQQDRARQVRPPMAEAEQQNLERRQDMARQQIRPPAQEVPALKRSGRSAGQVQLHVNGLATVFVGLFAP